MQVIPNVINGISGTQSLTSPGHHEVILRVNPMAFVLSFLAIVLWGCTDKDNEIHADYAPEIDNIDLPPDNSLLSVYFSKGVFDRLTTIRVGSVALAANGLGSINTTDVYQRALGTGLLSINLQLGWARLMPVRILMKLISINLQLGWQCLIVLKSGHIGRQFPTRTNGWQCLTVLKSGG